MKTEKPSRIAFVIIAALTLAFSCVLLAGCNSGSNAGTSGTNTSKPAKNGFNEKTNKTVTIGDYSFSIPNYFVETTSKSSGTSKTFGISKGSSPVGILHLECNQLTGSEASAMKNAGQSQIDDFFKGFEEGIQKSGMNISNTRSTSIAGHPAKAGDFVMDVSGYTLTGSYMSFIDTNTAETIFLSFGTTENADYDYSGDFQKIVESASKTSSSAKPSSSSSNSGSPTNSNEVSPDFKKTMDSYEAFFNEYVDFMKEYMENPTNTKLLSKYSNMLSQYSKMMNALNAIDKDSLSPADATYYLEVSSRITNKLAEIL